MPRPIFFDPTGRRRRWIRRSIFAGLGALVLLALAFASTVVTIPTPEPLPLGFERQPSAILLRARPPRSPPG